jgi:hypothetical protein
VDSERGQNPKSGRMKNIKKLYYQQWAYNFRELAFLHRSLYVQMQIALALLTISRSNTEKILNEHICTYLRTNHLQTNKAKYIIHIFKAKVSEYDQEQLPLFIVEVLDMKNSEYRILSKPKLQCNEIMLAKKGNYHYV